MNIEFLMRPKPNKIAWLSTRLSRFYSPPLIFSLLHHLNNDQRPDAIRHVLQTGVAQLSYDGLKQLEKLILSKVGSAGQERAYMIEQLFYDITTSAGTNPSVLLIKDKILSGNMSQEPNPLGFWAPNCRLSPSLLEK